MRTQSYLKNKCEQTVTDVFDNNLWKQFASEAKTNKRIMILSTLIIVLFLAILALFLFKDTLNVSLGELNPIPRVSAPLSETATQRVVLNIPTGVVKANPFLPYRDLDEPEIYSDIPEQSLVEPPEVFNENSEGARILDTIVSGILYDKYSPSAILNIEGSDYLVKKGDVVNNYNVLQITRDSVTVKLGENVYKAGIGEILTEGTIHHNDVSNLKNKFGGGYNE